MLKRVFRTQESQACFWAQRAVDLCDEIDDSSLDEYVPPLKEAVAALSKDRRVIVFGGGKCGKSTLLAGLAECPLVARADISGHYLRWRYRCKDGDAAFSRFLPLENLDGLELVDTKPCSDPEAAQSVLALLQGADAALAVIDGRSPQESPVWALLQQAPQDRLGNCLLAVTFTDTLPAEETLLLKEKLRDHTLSCLGVTLPLYFISPTLSRGMESFSLRVQEALSAPCGIRAAIREVVSKGLDLVHKQGRVLIARAAVARTDCGFLAGIEQEIDQLLHHQLGSLEQCSAACAEASMKALPGALSGIRRSLGWWFSPVVLLRLEVYGSGAEQNYYKQILREIGKQQQTSDENFAVTCGAHWQRVRPLMKKTLECEIGDFPEAELQQDLQRLRCQFGNDLYEPFARTHFRLNLSTVFNAQAGWMMGFLVAICVALAVAGVLGFTGQTPLALGMLLLSLLLWLGATAFHWLAARRIRRQVIRLAHQVEKDLKTSCKELVERLLISRVAAYRRLYTAPREKVARHEATLAPLQKIHKQINVQLSAAAPRL